MKTVLLILTLALMAAGPGVASSNIYSLIANGDLREAEDSLSNVSTASTRNGDLLFCASLLERDADQAVRLMEAALGAAVAPTHRERIYHRLAQYRFIQGDYEALGKIVAEYMAMFESGRHRDEMQRYSVIVDEYGGDLESALRQADRYAVSFGKGRKAQWGQIDKARVMLANRKRIGAVSVLRKLSREKGGPGVAPALYYLTLDAVEARRADDAVFFYNILRDSYPSAVGLDALIERMSDLTPGETPSAPEPRVETKPEPVVFTIVQSARSGLFRVPAHAENPAATFGSYGRPVDVKIKKIAGKSYHVVYVGRFADFKEAQKFKWTLEEKHGEVFQVISR